MEPGNSANSSLELSNLGFLLGTFPTAPGVLFYAIQYNVAVDLVRPIPILIFAFIRKCTIVEHWASIFESGVNPNEFRYFNCNIYRSLSMYYSKTTGSISYGGVHFHISAIDVRFSADGFALISQSSRLRPTPRRIPPASGHHGPRLHCNSLVLFLFLYGQILVDTGRSVLPDNVCNKITR